MVISRVTLSVLICFLPKEQTVSLATAMPLLQHLAISSFLQKMKNQKQG